MVSAVEKHYDERERYSKNDGCAPLRGLLNAVKNAEIVQQWVEDAWFRRTNQVLKKSITLVGAGHGAQVQFLQQNQFNHIEAYGGCASMAETRHCI